MTTEPHFTGRLRHLLYRCTGCRRLLTKYEILAVWEDLEANGGPNRGICPCGGGKVSPANATLFEELTRPSIWKVWWLDVVRPRLGL